MVAGTDQIPAVSDLRDLPHLDVIPVEWKRASWHGSWTEEVLTVKSLALRWPTSSIAETESFDCGEQIMSIYRDTYR